MGRKTKLRRVVNQNQKFFTKFSKLRFLKRKPKNTQKLIIRKELEKECNKYSKLKFQLLTIEQTHKSTNR